MDTFIDDWLNGQDGVEKITVAIYVATGNDGGALRADESPICQRADMLAHRVHAHTRRSANRFVAVPALVGPPVFTAEQEGVDYQLTGVEAEKKNIAEDRKFVTLNEQN